MQVFFFKFLFNFIITTKKKFKLNYKIIGACLSVLLAMRIRDDVFNNNNNSSNPTTSINWGGIEKLPASLYLSSPPVDLTSEHKYKSCETDIMLTPKLMEFINYYIKKAHTDMEEMIQLSPIKKSKKNLPPIFITASPDERLYDDILEFYELCTRWMYNRN